MSAWDSPSARVPSWLSGKAPATPSPTPQPACWALGAKIQLWRSLRVSCSTGRPPPLPWAQGPAPRCHSRPPLGVTCDSGSTPGLRACPCCLSWALLLPPHPVPQHPHTILLCPKPNAQKHSQAQGFLWVYIHPKPSATHCNRASPQPTPETLATSSLVPPDWWCHLRDLPPPCSADLTPLPPWLYTHRYTDWPDVALASPGGQRSQQEYPDFPNQPPAAGQDPSQKTPCPGSARLSIHKQDVP